MKFGLLPRKKIGKIFLALSLFLFPLFSCLYIVSINSSGLISEKLSLLVLLIAVFSFLMLVVGIIFILTGKDTSRKKLRLPFKIILGLFAIAWIVGGYTVVGLLYFSGPGFKNWLITTAMTTMNHQYLATWFYDDYDINTVLANNYVAESGEDTDPNLINFTEIDFSQATFKNEFDRVKLLKGKTIYINRDICKPGTHASERELVELYNQKKFDFFVNNNDNLKDLLNNLKNII